MIPSVFSAHMLGKLDPNLVLLRRWSFWGDNQDPAVMATPNPDCWGQNPRLFGLGIDNFRNWDQNRKLQDEGYLLGGVLKGDGFRYEGK